MVVELADGVGVGLGDVVVEQVLVCGIALDGLVVLLAHAADEVQHGGGGNGLLHESVAGDGLHEVEVRQERVLAKAWLVGDDHRGGLGLVALEVDAPVLGRDLLDAAELGEEVQVPVAAAELAVGHGAKAMGLLLGNEVADGLVGDDLERGVVDEAGLVVGTRLLEDVRA